MDRFNRRAVLSSVVLLEYLVLAVLIFVPWASAARASHSAFPEGDIGTLILNAT